MKKLILWDIDGTILHTHKVGRATIKRALEEILQHEIDLSPVSFSGKTDPQIFRDIFRANGLAEDMLEDTYTHALERYMALMRVHLTDRGVTVLPGVPAIVGTMHEDPDVELSLLTGNVQPMAFLKLALARVDSYFSYGAFGSDHEDRNALPAIAVERAHAHTGKLFAGNDVILIGDTPRDIVCSRAIGADVVAVCTGNYSREELAAHKPTLLLDDLSDTSALLDWISSR